MSRTIHATRSSSRFALIAALLTGGLCILAGCGPDDPPGFMDTDGDLIVDADDDCPTVPETENGYEDLDGCPDAVAVVEQVQPDLAGRWLGDTTLTVPQGRSFQGPQGMTISIAADGLSAEIAGFCPGGTGSASIQRRDGTTGWKGVYVCQPVAWGGCPSFSTIFFSLRVEVAGPHAAAIIGAGTVRVDDLDDRVATACDVSGEFTTESAVVQP